MAKKQYRDLVESTIAGIPCLLGVTYFYKQNPDYNCKDSDMDYYGYTEMEYDILDRKGYPAAWLEKKVTDKDTEKMEQDIIDYFQD